MLYYNNKVSLLPTMTLIDFSRLIVFENIIHAIDTVKTKFGVVLEMGKKEITKSCRDI